MSAHFHTVPVVYPQFAASVNTPSPESSEIRRAATASSNAVTVAAAARTNESGVSRPRQITFNAQALLLPAIASGLAVVGHAVPVGAGEVADLMLPHVVRDDTTIGLVVGIPVVALVAMFCICAAAADGGGGGGYYPSNDDIRRSVRRSLAIAGVPESDRARIEQAVVASAVAQRDLILGQGSRSLFRILPSPVVSIMRCMGFILRHPMSVFMGDLNIPQLIMQAILGNRSRNSHREPNAPPPVFRLEHQPTLTAAQLLARYPDPE
jgi:hypothetical protein